MKHKGAILSVIVGYMVLSGLHGQDPVFSHFYANALQMNPSLAGIEGTPKLFIGYRNQWPNTGSSYITYHASYDQYVEKLHGGLGVRMVNDRQGDGVFNAYNLDFMYAYQFQATRRLSLSGGLQAGLGQRHFDPSSLQFGDMFNPVTGGLRTDITPENISLYNVIYPDFGAGVSAFYGNFYGGIAMHHLFSPVVTDSNDPTGKIPRKLTVHFGALIPIIEKQLGKEVMQLSPNMVIIQQLNIQQLNYGMDLIYRDFVVGLWTRHDWLLNYGNIIFTAGYGSDNLRFRYSYDVRLSNPAVQLQNLGAHEFSLLIIYENLRRRNKHRAIKCPKI
ncbi:MAG: PorP/SprF family type IX secretion system membrane protein [Bacteroidales bacterium]